MKKNRACIIAEAGVNHNGNIDKAVKMIQTASKIGADIIKFQAFNVDETILKNTRKAKYQLLNTKKNEDQYEMIKKFEFSFQDFRYLKKMCKKYNIEFMCSIFDIKTLNLLKKLELKKFKIPSGEINNYPLLIELGKLKKELILSTGMSTMIEIKNAINLLTKSGTPKNKISILHCHSAYPTNLYDVNLLAMRTIGEKFRIKFGFSDHTKEVETAICAVCLGAKIIEKHLTLNNFSKGPDHKASLNPKDFASMVKGIRNAEIILGSKIKKPQKNELKNIKFVRKSFVAIKNIKKNDILNLNNISLKRPGIGIQGDKWFNIQNKKSSKNYKIGELIKEKI